MLAALLEKPVSDNQAWIELCGAEVIDIPRRTIATDATSALRRALARGLAVDPDPRRANFYEASLDGYRFYFHVVPDRPCKVYLIARWRDL